MSLQLLRAGAAAAEHTSLFGSCYNMRWFSWAKQLWLMVQTEQLVFPLGLGQWTTQAATGRDAARAGWIRFRKVWNCDTGDTGEQCLALSHAKINTLQYVYYNHDNTDCQSPSCPNPLHTCNLSPFSTIWPLTFETEIFVRDFKHQMMMFSQNHFTSSHSVTKYQVKLFFTLSNILPKV